MMTLTRIVSFPFRCLVVLCLLVVFGEKVATEFEDGVQAFFNGLE